MRYIKPFNEAKRGEPNPEKIENFLERFAIYEYSLNPDGTVDFEGNLFFDSDKKYFSNLKKLPINIGSIDGFFEFTNAYALTSLEGFPNFVQESFFFRTFDNGGKGIRSMVGGPTHVGGDYVVKDSYLTTLEGIAEYIGGNLELSNNPITSLKGAPKEIGGHLELFALDITDLEGCPEVIGGDLILSDSTLTSLKGFPKKVNSVYLNTDGVGIWDPRELRDSECKMIFCRYEPLHELIDLFNVYRTKRNYDELANSEDTFKIFKESLDYNYVKGLKRNRPRIDLFRLKEALSEFDIVHKEPFTLNSYDFVNEKGEVVDFAGNKINK